MPRQRKIPVAEQALAQQGCKCLYCGASLYEFEAWSTSVMDHSVPLHLGGESTLDNLVACCSLCNTLKGGYHTDDPLKMREFIDTKREEWRKYWELHIKPLCH